MGLQRSRDKLDNDYSSLILQRFTRVDWHGDSPLSQRAAIANGRYCHVMYKLLYPSIMLGQDSASCIG